MVAGGAKSRAPSNHEILASQGLQEGHFAVLPGPTY
jgi:hypothetical protein